jgi:methyl-accepting chemotaxis protein
MMANFSTTSQPMMASASDEKTKIAASTRAKLMVSAALLTIVFLRVFSDDLFQSSDAWLARPGDSLLLIASMFLACCVFFWPEAAKSAKHADPSSALDDILKSHLDLDAEIEKKLIEVVSDTENSALKIISEVRQLYDSANTLVVYLDESKETVDKMGQEIIESVQHLKRVEDFVAQLPAQMKSDLDNVQIVSKEINALANLVGAVKAISMQSHLLSINAAIEGSRAGPSGASFRVVAGEMRKLASNSNEVANQISQGLLRANAVVTGGIASSIAESSERLDVVLAAADSIQKFQENFTGITDFYKSRFSVITQNNHDLALNIAEVLGQIQYQDVVSQSIDRMMATMNQRNALLEAANTELHQGFFDRHTLPAKLNLVMQTYLIEEEKHKHSARHDEAGATEQKIELF